MSILSNNPYSNALRNINILLDPDQKKRGVIMFGLLVINAFFDIIGMASIIPLIDAAVNPETITEKWYLKWPYELIGMNDSISFLFVLSTIILIIFLIKNLISIIILYIQAKYAFNVSKRLSLKMYQYYYSRGYSFMSDKESGKKIYDTMWLPYYFGSSYLLETLILSTEIVVMLFIFGALLYYQPMAVLLLIVIIVPVFLVVYMVTKNKTRQLGLERNKIFPVVSSLILDSYNAYNDVILFNKEDHFYSNFARMATTVSEIDSKQNGIYAKIHQRLNDIVLILGLVAVFGFALLFRERSQDILALLGIFGVAAYRFLPSVNRIMSSFLTLKNFNYVPEELKTLKGLELKEFDEVKAMNFNENIVLEKVSFSFGDESKKVLNEVSLEIRKGDVIGIIGPSGSGKTTLMNIFLRFLIETTGQILIDGNPVTLENQRSFQKALGYVQQSVYIRNGSLVQNIAFGEDEAEIDKEKLDWAIKNSMLSDFVNEHPMGIEMQLGENGIKLSGGQKQRIGIARALYKDAKIILLDEITSALDPQTEKNIILTINHLADMGKTILIIAHRMSTLERCNKIFELKDGAIAHQNIH